jgi:hypothetical protein
MGQTMVRNPSPQLGTSALSNRGEQCGRACKKSLRSQEAQAGRAEARGFDKAHGVAFAGLSKRRAPSTIRSQSPVIFIEFEIVTKEDVMPAVDAVIVAAIVAAFVIFAGVLAWAEYQTRDLPPRARTTRPPTG